MNVFAIYTNNQHIAELLVEAENRRLLRGNTPRGRGPVASIRDLIRNVTASRSAKLTASPQA